ncbi:hypothetical protein ACFQ68_18720 [Amycolatopsis japonica]|uniref:hypothetical protein n=1 Tax=Amycolatopsis japonica TaxID=208439 RepID=UPI00366FAB5F
MPHALPGEHYVELVADGVDPDDHPGFPARIDDIPLRASRFGARARLRADVLPFIQRWMLDNPALGTELQLDPADSHAPDGQALTLRTSGIGWERTLKIWPDNDGLYELCGDTTWFLQLSVPSMTAATIKSIHRKLVKPSNLLPEPGEVLVKLADSQIAFPAIVDERPWGRAEVPYFRPQIAKIVSAWLNYVHITLDDAYSRTYWEGDTLIVVESNTAALEGCHPDHLEPGTDGRYAIGWRGWAWEIA